MALRRHERGVLKKLQAGTMRGRNTCSLPRGESTMRKAHPWHTPRLEAVQGRAAVALAGFFAALWVCASTAPARASAPTARVVLACDTVVDFGRASTSIVGIAAPCLGELHGSLVVEGPRLTADSGERGEGVHASKKERERPLATVGVHRSLSVFSRVPSSLAILTAGLLVGPEDSGSPRYSQTRLRTSHGERASASPRSPPRPVLADEASKPSTLGG
jgi:hypothetical protein